MGISYGIYHIFKIKHFIRRFFLYLSDRFLKKCFWLRAKQKNKPQNYLSQKFNHFIGCDCEKEAALYYSSEAHYQDYLWQQGFLSCIEKRQAQRQIKYWQYRPLISIQLGVYKTDYNQLKCCLHAVAKQLYPHWQLCIVDDGSLEPNIEQILKQFQKDHSGKVKLTIRKENRGITQTSIEAFNLTEGEFVALLDHDDYLAPNALYEVVKALNKNPKKDWFYSYNDKIDIHQQRCCLHLKPAWSPDLLYTYNYILHLSVIRKTLMAQIGSFRDGFEGSQDHDLYLRLADATNRVQLIPKVLYSWRQSAASVALNPEAKNYAYESALKALDAALVRTKKPARAIHAPHSWLGSYQIIRQIEIPEINIVIIDGDLRSQQQLQYELQKQRIKIKQIFKLSNLKQGRQMHDILTQNKSPYLLLISTTVILENNQSILELVKNLQQPAVVLANPKIIQKNKVDHCGLAYQKGKIIYPLRGWDQDLDGVGAYGALVRNISIGSPICACIKTQSLADLYGLPEKNQKIEAWLIELSFLLTKHYYRIIANGGVSVQLNQQTPYQMTLTKVDIQQLNQKIPKLFNQNDPLFHQQMK